MDKYRLLNLHAELTGYTVKALNRKIEDGVWMCGKEYMYSPDGRIQVIIEGYNSWVERERSRSEGARNRSNLSSTGRASNALSR